MAERAERLKLQVSRLAASCARSRGYQYPLKLWPDDPNEPSTGSWFAVIEGELHYLPAPCERPRLARNFLHAHAAFPHEVDTPSVAQLRNLPGIVALARDMPIEDAMVEVEDAVAVMQTCNFPFPTPEDDFVYHELDWYTLLKGDTDTTAAQPGPHSL